MKKILALFRFFYLKFSTPGLTIKKISFIGNGVRVKIKGGGRILCGGKIRLDSNAELESQGRLEIGDHFVLNPYSRIICPDFNATISS